MMLEVLRAVSGEPSVPTIGSFVDGRLLPVDEATETFDVIEPATSRLLARVAESGQAGVDHAVATAKAAFPAWRATPARDRAALVRELGQRITDRAEEIALLDARDTGNPLSRHAQ